MDKTINIHFTDYFGLDPDEFEATGALNVSLINDMPLFIDPFLLFNSKKPQYQQLHDEIIRYVRFLREKAVNHKINAGLLVSWFTFPEVVQNWLGFSKVGNKGSGLGIDFAKALNRNLVNIFSNFGTEEVTQGSHIEKLTLIKEGVGKDNISDFTTNLIKRYLLEFTEEIAKQLVAVEQKRKLSVEKVDFNYETETWVSREFELPHFNGDYILLTPRDMLTRDETWINRDDMVEQLDSISMSLPNEQLRAQVNNYLIKMLPENPTKGEEKKVKTEVFMEFPELLEYYIRVKEENGDFAKSISELKVDQTIEMLIHNVAQLAESLGKTTDFYQYSGDTYQEAKQRALYLKRFIEDQGGHRLFYLDGEQIGKEADLQLMFKLTWFGTASDVSKEVNDGRGPVDYKISRGAYDKSLIEFKLATNTQLKRNLENQVEIYKKASDTDKAIKVIMYFSKKEQSRVLDILHELALSNDPDIILIDARIDNKPSGSKA